MKKYQLICPFRLKPSPILCNC